MSLPAPLAGLLAAVFLAAAALCTVSLWRRRARHEGPVAAAEANHVVMALGMAAMVLPATATALPPLAGAVLFGVIGVAWTVRLVALRARGRALGSPIGGDRCAAHPTHLLLSNAAMVVMYAVMLPSGGTAGHAGHAGHGAASPLALSAVGVALALYLLVHAGATVAVLVRASAPVAVTVGGGGGPGPVGRFVDAPAVQLGCQAVTGAGMALMLLVH
ncbi:DUF5134 domain-containing protein [Actinomycetospora sp. CA-101289]|uniref:DUF5134 domain-containing protein n=1 Tax=Actinomycetospora sp. CA-101289 TaxID=3239893 RepID=UPI003D999591